MCGGKRQQMYRGIEKRRRERMRQVKRQPMPLKL